MAARAGRPWGLRRPPPLADLGSKELIRDALGSLVGPLGLGRGLSRLHPLAHSFLLRRPVMSDWLATRLMRRAGDRWEEHGRTNGWRCTTAKSIAADELEGQEKHGPENRRQTIAGAFELFE